jgi:hypothetical protein
VPVLDILHRKTYRQKLKKYTPSLSSCAYSAHLSFIGLGSTSFLDYFTKRQQNLITCNTKIHIFSHSLLYQIAHLPVKKNSKNSQKISKIVYFPQDSTYALSNQDILLPPPRCQLIPLRIRGCPPPHRANVTYIILKNSTKKAVLSVKF